MIYKPFDNQWLDDVEYTDDVLDSGVVTTGSFMVAELVVVFIYDVGSFDLGELILGSIGANWARCLMIEEQPWDLDMSLLDAMIAILRVEEK